MRSVLALELLRLESLVAEASVRSLRAVALHEACASAYSAAEAAWEAAVRAARFDEGVGPEAVTVSQLESGRASRSAAVVELLQKLEEARRALASAGSAVALAEAAESSACKALEQHRRLAGRR
jgi:hypothetical protein